MNKKINKKTSSIKTSKKLVKSEAEKDISDEEKDVQTKSENTTKIRSKLNSQERVSTGVENLDVITAGGFVKNSTNLIFGGSGSGKSILCSQFLIDGAKKGEKCLYISFEEEKGSFYKNLKDLGQDLEKYEKEEKFFFLEYTPKKVQTMLEEGGGIIENMVLKRKITRIVIDSITSFALLFENEIRQREALLSLFNLLGGWDCTTILTYQRDPTQKAKTSRILEFEADSIILLYFIRKENERKRYIEVLKMRGVDHSKKIYEFFIEKGGVKISKEPISGKVDEL